MTNLRRKLGQYQANGAQLGWLLLPDQRAVEIWRGGQEGMAERLAPTVSKRTRTALSPLAPETPMGKGGAPRGGGEGTSGHDR